MRDRDLRARIIERALSRLGCRVAIKGGYLVAWRVVGDVVWVSKQHLHKGARDVVRRVAVRTFYRAVEDVE